jgi:hypothetical protein
VPFEGFRQLAASTTLLVGLLTSICVPGVSHQTQLACNSNQSSQGGKNKVSIVTNPIGKGKEITRIATQHMEAKKDPESFEWHSSTATKVLSKVVYAEAQ